MSPILERYGKLKPLPDPEEIEEDTYAEDVLLFEKYEFPVFMNIMAIFINPQKAYGALHILSIRSSKAYPYDLTGWTPIEIAHDIYNNQLTGYEEETAKRLAKVYDWYI